MHALLESYLSEVAAHLGALPKARRSEELREMRTHLENAVIVNHELGQSADEAAQTAVAQFGMAQDLGANVVWAWRRGETRNRRSFWGAVVSTPLTLLSLMLAISHLPNGPIPWLDPWLLRYCIAHNGASEVIGMALAQGMFLTVFMLAGVAVGVLAPKRALRAVGLGLTVFFVGWTVVDGRSGLPMGWDRAGWILTAVGSAWAVSRWRQVRRGSVRPARG